MARLYYWSWHIQIHHDTTSAAMPAIPTPHPLDRFPLLSAEQSMPRNAMPTSWLSAAIKRSASRKRLSADPEKNQCQEKWLESQGLRTTKKYLEWGALAP